MYVGNSTLNGVTISTGSTATVQNGTALTLTARSPTKAPSQWRLAAATPM